MKLGPVYFPRLRNTSPATTKSGGLSSVDQTPPQIQFAIVIALLPGPEHFDVNLISRGPESPDERTARTKAVSARHLLISSQHPRATHITTAPLVPTGLLTWHPPRWKPTGEKA